MSKKLKKIKYKSLREQRKEEKLKRRKKELAIVLGLIITFAIVYLLCTWLSGEQITIKNNNPVASGKTGDDAEKNADILVSSTTDYEGMADTQKQIQQESQRKAIEKDSQPQPQPPANNTSKKVAYLTFDDGPSANTVKILDILKGYGIKATFFVLGQMAEHNKEIIKREKAEGHLIANHTYSHNYKYLYASPDNFLKDFKKNEDVLRNILGEYNCSIVRFPGGSYGRNQAFKDTLANNGYKFFDWNCSNGDADAVKVNKDKLINNIKNTYRNQKQLVVLMHDAPAKTTTPEALPAIIDFLKAQGYEFSILY